jgi:hypothetical protein
MEKMERKEFWIAILINLLLPGGGHIYVGHKNGVPLLVVNIISWALTPFLSFPFLGAIVTWIYALATTRSVVDECNAKVDESEKEVKEAQEKYIKLDEFIESFNKIQLMISSKIIDQSEYDERKRAKKRDN